MATLVTDDFDDSSINSTWAVANRIGDATWSEGSYLEILQDTVPGMVDFRWNADLAKRHYLTKLRARSTGTGGNEKIRLYARCLHTGGGVGQIAFSDGYYAEIDTADAWLLARLDGNASTTIATGTTIDVGLVNGTYKEFRFYVYGWPPKLWGQTYHGGTWITWGSGPTEDTNALPFLIGGNVGFGCRPPDQVGDTIDVAKSGSINAFISQDFPVGPFNADVSEIYVPGAAASEVYAAGAAASEIYLPGAAAAEISAS